MKGQWKGFIAGILAAMLLAGFTTTAIAAYQKTATLNYNDIKITMDGERITPKDANGNVVEPFIIEGTTYLPVRGIATALGLNVSWDQATQTAILTSQGASTTPPASTTGTAVGTVLVEQNGIKITYNGMTMASGGRLDVSVIIENSNAEAYMVQTRDESVNGVMCSPIFSCDVAAGKKAIDTISFYDSSLSKVGVSSVADVEEISFYFTIFESGDWLNSFDSAIVTIK